MSKKFSKEKVDQFLNGYQRFVQMLNGEATGPLQARRQEAIRRFAEIGFPTTRHEEWKYTNVAPIERTAFVPALSLDDQAYSAEEVRTAGFRTEGTQLVFINGLFAADLSSAENLPEGVIVSSLARAIREHTDVVVPNIADYAESFEHSFAALNTAHLRDGAFIFVPKNVAVESPIHLLFYSTSADHPVVSYPRILVVIESGASATIVEEYAGREGATYLTDVVAEVTVGDNARFDHVRIQHESLAAYHVGAAHTRLGRDSRYYANAISFGAAIGRHDPVAELNGEGGHASLDGLYLAGEGQLLDSHTVIDHTTPNCTSHELYKGILRENGRGVFNGKIFVRKDAQKIDSKQSNMNLLLSNDAVIDTKPQLEIFADDVKCTHGATIGRLDERGIFYLRARGIGEAEAKQIMTFAFAAEVIEHIKDDGVREYAMGLLERRLARS